MSATWESADNQAAAADACRTNLQPIRCRFHRLDGTADTRDFQENNAFTDRFGTARLRSRPKRSRILLAMHALVPRRAAKMREQEPFDPQVSLWSFRIGLNLLKLWQVTS